MFLKKWLTVVISCGEQSGHIILSDYATTGDGVLTALKPEIVAATKSH